MQKIDHLLPHYGHEYDVFLYIGKKRIKGKNPNCISNTVYSQIKKLIDVYELFCTISLEPRRFAIRSIECLKNQPLTR
jgi:hypothetical protein